MTTDSEPGRESGTDAPLVHIFADESCLGNQFENRRNPGAAAGLIERFDERHGWYRRDFAHFDPDTTKQPDGDRVRDRRAGRPAPGVPRRLHERQPVPRPRNEGLGARLGPPRLAPEGRADREPRSLAGTRAGRRAPPHRVALDPGTRRRREERLRGPPGGDGGAGAARDRRDSSRPGSRAGSRTRRRRSGTSSSWICPATRSPRIPAPLSTTRPNATDER